MKDRYERFREEAEQYFESELDIEYYVQLRMEGNDSPTAFRLVIDSIIHAL